MDNYKNNWKEKLVLTDEEELIQIHTEKGCFIYRLIKYKPTIERHFVSVAVNCGTCNVHITSYPGTRRDRLKSRFLEDGHG
jgi:hypothetical protein